MIPQLLHLLFSLSTVSDEDDDGMDMQLLRFVFFFAMMVLVGIFLYFCIREIICGRTQNEDNFVSNDDTRTRYDTLRSNLVIKNIVKNPFGIIIFAIFSHFSNFFKSQHTAELISTRRKMRMGLKLRIGKISLIAQYASTLRQICIKN